MYLYMFPLQEFCFTYLRMYKYANEHKKTHKDTQTYAYAHKLIDLCLWSRVFCNLTGDDIFPYVKTIKAYIYF